MELPRKGLLPSIYLYSSFMPYSQLLAWFLSLCALSSTSYSDKKSRFITYVAMVMEGAYIQCISFDTPFSDMSCVICA